MEEFVKILKTDGCFILDHRNGTVRSEETEGVN